MKHQIVVPEKLGHGPIPTRIEVPRISIFRWGFFVNLLREVKRFGYRDFSITVVKRNFLFKRVTIHCRSFQTARFISSQLEVF